MPSPSFASRVRHAIPALREVHGNPAPSPPQLPIIGHLPSSGIARLDVLLKLALELGPVVRFELPFVTAHLLSSPDHVERVLVKEHRLFSKKTRGYDQLRQFLGNGLVTSEGDFWLRQRRIAQPAFHKQRIAGFAKTFVRCAEELGLRWEQDAKSGRTIDLHADMMKLTLRIASLTLLSADTGDRANEVGEAIDLMLHESVSRINNPFRPPDSWPTPANRRAERAMKTLDKVVLDIIDARRKGKREDDLLQMLLEARDEETGEGMTDRQLRDEVMTMFLAGHETTANALTWTFVLLSRFPQVARSLAAEASTVLGPDRSATAEDATQLEVSRRVLSESMRLYPPVWVIGRSPEEDVEFDGYSVPKGSLLFLSPWVTHRLPSLWDDPEGFDPDRFAPERQKLMHRHQYFPFSLGPRMCIGVGFAMLEGQLVLSTLARRFRLDLLPGHPIIPEPLITLRPKGAVPMTVHLR